MLEVTYRTLDWLINEGKGGKILTEANHLQVIGKPAKIVIRAGEKSLRTKTCRSASTTGRRVLFPPAYFPENTLP